MYQLEGTDSILLYGVPVSTTVQAMVVRYTFVVTGIVIILIPSKINSMPLVGTPLKQVI
jgi:hypothetical protein